MSASATFRITFLTLRNYSLIAVSSAIDVLRMANLVAGRKLYTWELASLDGEPAACSNGHGMSPTRALQDTARPELLLVCGGTQIEQALTPRLREALCTLGAQGVHLGALYTGVYALAVAGLLNGYRAAAHWEYLHLLKERYPAIRFSRQAFEIDRDRYTCSGGLSAVDLLLSLVVKHQGARFAEQISDMLVLNRIRERSDQQAWAAPAYTGVYSESLHEVVALMDANIEEPLPLVEISRLVGISTRQIERLFKQYLNKTPTIYYLDKRLHKARALLLDTRLSIIEISLACGFQTPQYFSKRYRMSYGISPSEQREQASRQNAGAARQSADPPRKPAALPWALPAKRLECAQPCA